MTDDTKQLIADLRGGVPEHCSFCGDPSDRLEPEEAGEWACPPCSMIPHVRVVETDLPMNIEVVALTEIDDIEAGEYGNVADRYSDGYAVRFDSDPREHRVLPSWIMSRAWFNRFFVTACKRFEEAPDEQTAAKSFGSMRGLPDRVSYDRVSRDELWPHAAKLVQLFLRQLPSWAGKPAVNAVSNGIEIEWQRGDRNLCVTLGFVGDIPSIVYELHDGDRLVRPSGAPIPRLKHYLDAMRGGDVEDGS